MKTQSEINLPDIIGGGYGAFWRFKGRYRVVKGSRASKKSATTALNLIFNIIKYPEANILVVRKTFRTLKDSCFAQLKWAMRRLGVEHLFDCKLSPLEITYRPTGQKIFFRGLDDPLKITSIAVDVGVLCFVWIEEAYEITNETDFDMLDESIRGQSPPGLYKQFTITLNPWNAAHWIKKRFFDTPNDDTLAITTNYMCNEFLDASDLKIFERMKETNPKRYKVAGLGDWGIVDGLVYDNWETSPFDVAEISKRDSVRSAFGLDFGYTNDPSAFVCMLIDTKARELYIFDEMYQRGMINDDIFKKINYMGYAKERIVADSAEPKSIFELKRLGLRRIKASKKGPDSIKAGIQFIQGYKIIIHPRCVNFITEISNYQWDEDKFGNKINKPVDDFNHLMDAMRYALEEYQIKRGGGIFK